MAGVGRGWLAEDEPDEARDGAGAKRPSSFYDFSETDLARLTAVLERLAAATDGKPTALLLIPTQRDLERRAVSGPDRLTPRLAEITQRLGIHLVDLMKPMTADNLHSRGYFFPCDYHWSPHATFHRLQGQVGERHRDDDAAQQPQRSERRGAR